MASVEEYILNFKLNFSSARTSLTNFVSQVERAQKSLDDLGRKETNVLVGFDPTQIKAAFDSALSRSQIKAEIDTALTISATNINFKPLQDEIAKRLRQTKTKNKKLTEVLDIDVHLADTKTIFREIEDIVSERKLSINPILDPKNKSLFVNELTDFLKNESYSVSVNVKGEDITQLKELGKAVRDIKTKNLDTHIDIKTGIAKEKLETFWKTWSTLPTHIDFTEEEKGKVLKKIKTVLAEPHNLKFKTDNFTAEMTKNVEDSLQASAGRGIRKGLSLLKDKKGETPVTLDIKEVRVKKIIIPTPVMKSFKENFEGLLSTTLAKIDITKINILSLNAANLTLTSDNIKLVGTIEADRSGMSSSQNNNQPDTKQNNTIPEQKQNTIPETQSTKRSRIDKTAEDKVEKQEQKRITKTKKEKRIAAEKIAEEKARQEEDKVEKETVATRMIIRKRESKIKEVHPDDDYNTKASKFNDDEQLAYHNNIQQHIKKIESKYPKDRDEGALSSNSLIEAIVQSKLITTSKKTGEEKPISNSALQNKAFGIAKKIHRRELRNDDTKLRNESLSINETSEDSEGKAFNNIEELEDKSINSRDLTATNLGQFENIKRKATLEKKKLDEVRKAIADKISSTLTKDQQAMMKFLDSQEKLYPETDPFRPEIADVPELFEHIKKNPQGKYGIKKQYKDEDYDDFEKDYKGTINSLFENTSLIGNEKSETKIKPNEIIQDKKYSREVAQETIEKWKHEKKIIGEILTLLQESGSFDVLAGETPDMESLMAHYNKKAPDASGKKKSLKINNLEDFTKKFKTAHRSFTSNYAKNYKLMSGLGKIENQEPDEYEGDDRSLSGLTPYVKSRGYANFGPKIDKFANLATYKGEKPTFTSDEDDTNRLSSEQKSAYDHIKKEVIVRPEVVAEAVKTKNNIVLVHELLHGFFENYGKTIQTFSKNIESQLKLDSLRSVVESVSKGKFDASKVEKFAILLNEITDATKRIPKVSTLLTHHGFSKEKGGDMDVINSSTLSSETLKAVQMESLRRKPLLKEFSGSNRKVNEILVNSSEKTKVLPETSHNLLNSGQEFTVNLISVLDSLKNGFKRVNSKNTQFDGGIDEDFGKEIMKKFGKFDISSVEGIKKLTQYLKELSVSASKGDIDPIFVELVRLMNFFQYAGNQHSEKDIPKFKENIEEVMNHNKNAIYEILGIAFREQEIRADIFEGKGKTDKHVKATMKLPELEGRKTELKKIISRKKSTPDEVKNAERSLRRVESQISYTNNLNPINRLNNIREKTLKPQIEIPEGSDLSSSRTYKKKLITQNENKADLKSYLNQLKEVASFGKEYQSLLPKKIQDDIKNIDKLELKLKSYNKEMKISKEMMKDLAAEEIKKIEAKGKFPNSSLLAAREGLVTNRSNLAEGLASGRYRSNFEPARVAWAETSEEERAGLRKEYTSKDHPHKERNKKRLDEIDKDVEHNPLSYKNQISKQSDNLRRAIADSKKFNTIRRHTVTILSEEGTAVRYAETLWIDHGKIVSVNAEKLGAMQAAVLTLGGTFHRTLSRVLQWGSASYAIYSVFNAFKQAKDVIVEFDNQLKVMQSLTNSSKSQLDGLSRSAEGLGKKYGRSISEVASSMNEFLRQGIAVTEVTKATEQAMLLSNVAMIDAVEANKLLVSVSRQFTLQADSYAKITDKLTALGDAFAVSAEDIAKGMANSGSTAKTFGLDMDQLGAVIATVGEATQRTGSQVGTAFRTIMSRGITSRSINLFKALGIQVLGTGGSIKAFGDVIDEIGLKWTSFSQVQQASIAKALGGRTRLNSVFSLFQNYGRYLEGVTISQDSMGSSSRKNSIIMEGMGKKIESAKAAVQGLIVTLGAQGMGIVIGALTGMVDKLTHGIEGLNDAMGGIVAPTIGIGGMGVGGLAGLSMFANTMGLRGMGGGAFEKKESTSFLTGRTQAEALKYFESKYGERDLSHEHVNKLKREVRLEKQGGIAYKPEVSKTTIRNRIGMVGQLAYEFGKLILVSVVLSAVIAALIKGYEFLSASTAELNDKNNIAIGKLQETEKLFKNIVNASGKYKVTDNRIESTNDIKTTGKEKGLDTETLNKLSLSLLKNNDDFSKYLKLSSDESGNYKLSVKGVDRDNSPENTLSNMYSNFQKSALDSSLNSISAFSVKKETNPFRRAYREMHNNSSDIISKTGKTTKTNDWSSVEAKNMMDAWNSEDIGEISKRSEELSKSLELLYKNTDKMMSLKGFSLNNIFSDPKRISNFQERIKVIGEDMVSMTGNSSLKEPGNEDKLQSYGARNLFNRSLESQGNKIFNPEDLTTNQKVYSSLINKGELKLGENGTDVEGFGTGISQAFGKIKNENGELVKSTSLYADTLKRVGKHTIAFIADADRQGGSMVMLSKNVNGSVDVLDDVGKKIRTLGNDELPNVINFTDKASDAFGNQAAVIDDLIDSFERLKSIINVTKMQLDQIKESANNAKASLDIQSQWNGYNTPDNRKQRNQIDNQTYESLIKLSGTDRNAEVIANQMREIKDFIVNGSGSSKLVENAKSESGINFDTGIETLNKSMQSFYNKVQKGDIKIGDAEGMTGRREFVKKIVELEKLKPSLIKGAEKISPEYGQAFSGYLDSRLNSLKATLQIANQRLSVPFEKGKNLDQSSLTAAQELANEGVISGDKTSETYKILNKNQLDDIVLHGEEDAGENSKKSPFDADLSLKSLLDIAKNAFSSLSDIGDQQKSLADAILKSAEGEQKKIATYLSQYGTIEASVDPSRKNEAAGYFGKSINELSEYMKRSRENNQFNPDTFKSMLKSFDDLLAINKQIRDNTTALKNAGIEGEAGLGTPQKQREEIRKKYESERFGFFKERDKLKDAKTPADKAALEQINKRIKENDKILDLKANRSFDVPGLGKGKDYASAATYYAEQSFGYGKNLTKPQRKQVEGNVNLQNLMSAENEDRENARRLGRADKLKKASLDKVYGGAKTVVRSEMGDNSYSEDLMFQDYKKTYYPATTQVSSDITKRAIHQPELNEYGSMMKEQAIKADLVNLYTDSMMLKTQLEIGEIKWNNEDDKLAFLLDHALKGIPIEIKLTGKDISKEIRDKSQELVNDFKEKAANIGKVTESLATATGQYNKEKSVDRKGMNERLLQGLQGIVESRRDNKLPGHIPNLFGVQSHESAIAKLKGKEVRETGFIQSRRRLKNLKGNLDTIISNLPDNFDPDKKKKLTEKRDEAGVLLEKYDNDKMTKYYNATKHVFGEHVANSDFQYGIPLMEEKSQELGNAVKNSGLLEMSTDVSLAGDNLSLVLKTLADSVGMTVKQFNAMGFYATTRGVQKAKEYVAPKPSNYKPMESYGPLPYNDNKTLNTKKAGVFHEGGLLNDEYMAILQKGEAVIPRNLVNQIPNNVLNKLPKHHSGKAPGSIPFQNDINEANQSIKEFVEKLHKVSESMTSSKKQIESNKDKPQSTENLKKSRQDKIKFELEKREFNNLSEILSSLEIRKNEDNSRIRNIEARYKASTPQNYKELVDKAKVVEYENRGNHPGGRLSGSDTLQKYWKSNRPLRHTYTKEPTPQSKILERSELSDYYRRQSLKDKPKVETQVNIPRAEPVHQKQLTHLEKHKLEAIKQNKYYTDAIKQALSLKKEKLSEGSTDDVKEIDKYLKRASGLRNFTSFSIEYDKYLQNPRLNSYAMEKKRKYFESLQENDFMPEQQVSHKSTNVQVFYDKSKFKQNIPSGEIYLSAKERKALKEKELLSHNFAKNIQTSIPKIKSSPTQKDYYKQTYSPKLIKNKEDFAINPDRFKDPDTLKYSQSEEHKLAVLKHAREMMPSTMADNYDKQKAIKDKDKKIEDNYLTYLTQKEIEKSRSPKSIMENLGLPSTKDMASYALDTSLEAAKDVASYGLGAAKSGISKLGKKFGVFHEGGLLDDEYMAILQKGEAVIPRNLVNQIPSKVMKSISNKAYNSIPKHHNGLAPEQTNTLDADISNLIREVNNLTNTIKDTTTTQRETTSGNQNTEALTEMFKLLYDGILELKNSNSNLGTTIAESISGILTPQTLEGSTPEASSGSTNRLDIFLNGETKLDIDINGNEIEGVTNDVVERVIGQIRQNPSMLLRILQNQPIIGIE